MKENILFGGIVLFLLIFAEIIGIGFWNMAVMILAMGRMEAFYINHY